MRRFLISILLFLTLISFTTCYSPKEYSFVIDQSGILDNFQRAKLDSLYYKHEKNTTNQIVLLTTDSFDRDSTIESYALRKFNSIGIGRKDINNGILIVFSASMRQVRIATGYGTEKVLTNDIAKKIIDSLMTPRFKQEEYFDGLWNASIAITEFLEKPENKIK